MKKSLCLLLAGFITYGCGIFDSEGERKVLGLVYPPDYGFQTGPPFVVPESAEVGVDFAVAVWTGGGCGRMGPTEVAIEGNTARITPFDFEVVLGDGEVCAGVPENYVHEVVISFEEVGEAQVIFTVRDFEQGRRRVDVTRTLEILGP